VSSPLTRFAPAPTGYIHLGHVLNAAFVWGLSRAVGGRVLLRIEDHDRQRCRPEYEHALLDDLDWLGFAPDIHPTSEFRQGATAGRQSDRDDAYRAALAPLVERGLVYGCDCTRKQIEGTRYSGRCRHRGLSPTEGVGWRVRLDDGLETFDDAALGPQRQEPSTQCGDLLIRDRLGNWTYQWAATTDDVRQQISLVIRGEDLLDSTGRQLALARLLGRSVPPIYLHHPLLMKSPTQKLSKSDHDTGVRDLRGAGWTAARVIGHAAWLGGLQPTLAALSAQDVTRLFETPAA
jgi:glutamyl-Q tRNA(Asp) synthetase